MIRYMLDTNTCIGVINNRPPELRLRLMQLDPAEVSISRIVHYELSFGVWACFISGYAHLYKFWRRKHPQMRLDGAEPASEDAYSA